MPKILNFHDDPYVGELTSEVLTEDGYQVVNLNDVELIWEHIEATKPELVLLDSDGDGFGTMNLYFEIKQKYTDLAVIVYKAAGFEAMDRIKAAVAEALGKYRLNGSGFNVQG
jgi:DNA-binding response OmpR family regulator